MPTYDYECKSCEHQVLDVKQGFEDKPLSLCPECNKEELFRIVTGGIHGSVKNINTIGSLADHNSKKYKSEIAEGKAMANELNPETPKPWYHNPKYGDASKKEVSQMSNERKLRYIMEGRK